MFVRYDENLSVIRYKTDKKSGQEIRPHNKGDGFAAKLRFCGILGACLSINQSRPLPKRRDAASRSDWAKNKK